MFIKMFVYICIILIGDEDTDIEVFFYCVRQLSLSNLVSVLLISI